MIKIFIRYRRNSDGEFITIEHKVKSENVARTWCTKMENAINKSEDVLIDCKWFYVKDGITGEVIK